MLFIWDFFGDVLLKFFFMHYTLEARGSPRRVHAALRLFYILEQFLLK